jgi:flavin reductase (DIM6/NTAB) family NADH-FMN oxidoreductase RutF
MLGLAASSTTTANLRRTGECVLNLPSSSLVAHVDRIARTTGSDPVPDGKRQPSELAQIPEALYG